MGFERLLAERSKHMKAGAIREILKVASKPGMVSMAGGLPSPGTFPLDIMGEMAEKVIIRYGAAVLQYDLTEGFPPLRSALVDFLDAKGISATAEDILVTCGSQGVLDAIGKVLISKGDRIAVEAPTYLGALQAFNPYEPVYIRMETDDHGLIPESLEEVLKSEPIKFVYLVPTFQNPTGHTLSLERREAIVGIIEKHDALLIEDDPYSSIRFCGQPVPAIKTLSPDHVVYAGSLSKVFAPGLRIGFCLAPEIVRRWLVIVKQGVDLHTSTFNQALAAEYLKGGYLDRYLPKIIDLYGPKLEAMLAALSRYFPEEYKWSRPEGGMFVWVEGPSGVDTEKIYWKAVERKTAFVPGKFFFTEPGEGLETMRLNFTMNDPAAIDHGIKVLAEVIAAQTAT